MTKKVQVYRLWPDKTYDLVDVEVEDPGTNGLDNAEIIESRAVSKEWLRISSRNLQKPLQIGLYMISLS